MKVTKTPQERAIKGRLIGAHVEEKLFAQLKAQAAIEDRTSASLLRHALKMYLRVVNPIEDNK